jgi:hypothetical protein
MLLLLLLIMMAGKGCLHIPTELLQLGSYALLHQGHVTCTRVGSSIQLPSTKRQLSICNS